VGGVRLEDFWDDGEERTLWTAKLFPILSDDPREQIGFSLGGKAIPAREVFSSCCWFIKVSTCGKTLIRTEEWRTSKRLSLKDLLTCGDGAQMLQWRLYVAALCQSSTDSRSSSLRSISHWTSCHHQITNLLHLMGTSLFTQLNPQAMSVCASLVLGLSLTRLCLRGSPISEHTLGFSTILFPSQVMGKIISEFDQTWDRLRSLDLVFVANSYLMRLLQFYSPSIHLLEVMRCLTSSLSFTEYPRYLLLIDWLIENQILELSQPITEIQPRPSPEMLLELFDHLVIKTVHSPSPSTQPQGGLVQLVQVSWIQILPYVTVLLSSSLGHDS
jgi:hypothetical protein